MENDPEDNMNILAKPEACNTPTENVEVDVYEELLLMEPLLIRDGELSRAKIIARKRDEVVSS